MSPFRGCITAISVHWHLNRGFKTVFVILKYDWISGVSYFWKIFIHLWTWGEYTLFSLIFLTTNFSILKKIRKIKYPRKKVPRKLKTRNLIPNWHCDIRKDEIPFWNSFPKQASSHMLKNKTLLNWAQYCSWKWLILMYSGISFAETCFNIR